MRVDYGFFVGTGAGTVACPAGAGADGAGAWGAGACDAGAGAGAPPTVIWSVQARSVRSFRERSVAGRLLTWIE